MTQAGDVDITLLSAGVPLGIGAGPQDGENCSFSTGVTAQPGPVPQLLLSAGVGTFCVIVADVGYLSVPIEYRVSVLHP